MDIQPHNGSGNEGKYWGNPELAKCHNGMGRSRALYSHKVASQPPARLSSLPVPTGSVIYRLILRNVPYMVVRNLPLGAFVVCLGK